MAAVAIRFAPGFTNRIHSIPCVFIRVRVCVHVIVNNLRDVNNAMGNSGKPKVKKWSKGPI